MILGLREETQRLSWAFDIADISSVRGSGRFGPKSLWPLEQQELFFVEHCWNRGHDKTRD